MIRITALTKGEKLINVESLEELSELDYKWYWADFEAPTEDEVRYLYDYFKFHHLAIEDCLHLLQRPKVDFYDGYNFFVLHAVCETDITPREVNLFIGENYIVSFHQDESLPEFYEARDELYASDTEFWDQGNVYIAYLIMDKIVDAYFPAIFKIEDDLKEYDDIDKGSLNKERIEMLFDIRGELLKLRRVVGTMRDLIYRVLNSSHLKHFLHNEVYFIDIYDHLLRLSEIIEANREITSDIRDSFISINSNRMNSVMTLLTIITTIFIPITFIAGVYGMNFKYMPELNHPYAYFYTIFAMFVVGFLMYLWFKRKGWFDMYK
ncbi:MAG: magnesium/cobalt transporter CorA [Eubacteriaceae bacterium]|nr:magnesium/cobalt transporter CorA [Eubacteriaceae bacterium]